MSAQEKRNENLPTVTLGDDGFDNAGTSDRLIQGEIARCVDGHWALRDSTAIPPEARYAAVGTAMALQLWRDGMPAETIVKRPDVALPDVDKLNSQIPQTEWEEGFDGKLRPPWVRQYVVYLLNVVDASILTFINSTKGAEIAVDRLKDRVRLMRALRGERVVPIVGLSSKVMKTKYGQKMRPEFTILEWRELGGLQTPATTPAIEHIGKPVEPPSLKEELNDELPAAATATHPEATQRDAAPWDDPAAKKPASTELDDDDRSAEAAKARLAQYKRRRRG